MSNMNHWLKQFTIVKCDTYLDLLKYLFFADANLLHELVCCTVLNDYIGLNVQ